MTARAKRCADFLRENGAASASEINAALHTTEARKIISEMIDAGLTVEKSWLEVIHDKQIKRFKVYRLKEET